MFSTKLLSHRKTIESRRYQCVRYKQYSIYLILSLGFISSSLNAQSISTVTPESQRVGEYVEIIGNSFGTQQGSSNIVFTNGSTTWNAGRAYVWRDNYIRFAIPVGKREGGAAVLIDKGPLEVFVQTPGGTSNSHDFQVIVSQDNSPSFRELTNIVSGGDVSTVLGSPNENDARTKDAEVSDVNGDGWLDIIDANSNNVQNGTHSVIRLNNRDKTFSAILLEPLDDADTGTFATEIESGGDFFEDHTSYDSDFADINNDRLPDFLQTAANNFTDGSTGHRIRILINNRAGVPGQFTEETTARMPADAFGDIGCPDDIDHIDMDDDGDIDFMVSMRTAVGFCDGSTSQIRVFENTGNGVFASPIVFDVRTNNSTHDVFWIDANHDGLYDIFAANEFSNVQGTEVRSELFLNNGAGGFTLNRSFDIDATTGAVADFNGDGLTDFIAGRTEVRVFLTNPTSPCLSSMTLPCEYTEVVLLPPAGGNNPFYDLEVGDINADGLPDVVGARILRTADNVPIFINDGDGSSFTEITGGVSSSVLPGQTGEFQRLSSDLIDFDNDGDLDLYLTGQDGGGDIKGDGANQFYENVLFGLNIVYPIANEPAYAGSATGGRKVLVRLRADLAVTGLEPDDFNISIDGEVLNIVTGAKIDEEFWLLVQMPAKPNGCYSLRVELILDTAIEDQKTNAVCYDDERLFDRVLVIDRTTSMLHNAITDTADPEKMDAAIAAANFFVNLSEDADQIAVTSFNRNQDDGDGAIEQNEMARTDWPMTIGFDPVTSTDNRNLAVSTIELLRPDGTYFPFQTTIGAGLRQGWDELIDEGVAGNDWQIVLLSDGRENLSPFWKDVDSGPPVVLPIKPDIASADPNITVHAIAIGQDADAPLLMDIASSTGGSFFNLYEGTGSFGLISRLSSVYKYIDEQMRTEQRFYYHEGVPPLQPSPFTEVDPSAIHVPKRVRVKSFYVPPDFESITVGFHWNVDNAVAQVRLFDADFVEINAAPPVQTILTDPKHKLFRIRNPKPGWYHYVVVVDFQSDFEFYVAASGISNVMVKARLGNVSETTPGQFQIPVRIVSGDFDPILNSSVTGEVVLPDKSRIPISLVDNGSSDDGLNADGIYGRVFTHSMPGPYSIFLFTRGLSNKNEPFERHSIVSFNFPKPDRPDQPEPPLVTPGDKTHEYNGQDCSSSACANDSAAYLIGSYDLKLGDNLIEVINPTARSFELVISLFDVDGNPLLCKKDKIPPNGLRQFDLQKLKLPEPIGVVKIVSFDSSTGSPSVGVVGNQRHRGEHESQVTGLHPISLEILKQDLANILAKCR